LTLADLGLDAAAVGQAGSGTEVLGVNAPPPRGESRRVEDNGNAAQAIVEFLAEKRLV
jgi:electron transfer flavoprotein beta subunit